MKSHREEMVAAVKARLVELEDSRIAHLLEQNLRGPSSPSHEVAAQIAGFERHLQELEDYV